REPRAHPAGGRRLAQTGTRERNDPDEAIESWVGRRLSTSSIARNTSEYSAVTLQVKPTLVDGGAAALTALRGAHDAGEPFSLALLDYMMPEMDGLTLAQQIKQDPRLAGCALIMLSSTDRRVDAARCRELGLVAHLTKPVRRAQLCATMVAALDA